MKTRNQSCMRGACLSASAILFLLSVLLLSACKKDSEPPVGPPDTDLLAQEAIGPSGGLLAADDITVEVPPGSFPTTEQIEIYRVDVAAPFGSSSQTDVFQLAGLPENFEQHITVKLRVDATPDGDGFIAVEKEMYAPSGAENRTVYEPFVASYTAPYLEVQLQAGDVYTSFREAGSEVRGTKTLTVNGFTGYIHEVDGSFELIYPKLVVLNTQELNGLAYLRQALEKAKSELVNKYHFTLDGRTKWPMKVIVKPLTGTNDAGDPIDGEAALSFWDSGEFNYGPNSGVIYINYGQLKNKQAIETTAAHEFFHLVQYLYTTSHTYDWLREASSTWFECAFSTDPQYYAPSVWNVPEYKRSLFDGLLAGSMLGKPTSDGKGVTSSRHGYGAFPVARYLNNRYGDASLKAIWEECGKGTHPLNAISWHTANYSEWWNDFVAKYYEEEVVSGAYLESILLAPSSIITLSNADKDTTFTFLKEMYDLSGAIYKVNVPTSGYTADHQLELKVTPGTGPKLFVYQPGVGSTRELIAEGKGQVIIEDWGAVATKGAIYILVSHDRVDVLNPLVKTPVKIEGHITKAIGPPNWTKCYLEFQIKGEIATYYPATQQTVTAVKTIGYSSQSSGDGPMIGSLSNNVFTGSNGQNSVSVTFDLSGQNITNFQWTGQGVGDFLANMTMSGGNIPSSYLIPWYWWYRRDGTAIQSSISQFTFQKNAPGEILSLNSWYAESYSFLYFQFD